VSPTARSNKARKERERKARQDAKRLERQRKRGPRDGLIERETETREQRHRYLIVCEGEKTEPNYFRAFPEYTLVYAIQVEGAGANTTSVVERAIELRDEVGGYEDDEVWAVFDRDSFPPERFNEALLLAKNRGIRVAYSNEAFELWYLLHFAYRDTGLSRTQYKSKLTRSLGERYRKNSEQMYDKLLPMQEQAIQNASRLLASHTPLVPESCNPSTTVHLLVLRLNGTPADDEAEILDNLI